jgi:hypothetical protein
MRYLGVSRSEKYSPNRVSGDAAVFRAVALELERCGHKVVCITEQELVSNGMPDDIDGIFQMVRSREALDILGQATVPVTNSIQAVLNCGRARQTTLLDDTGLIPQSLTCRTVGVPLEWNTYPCWIKRADSHAVDRDDVQFIQDAGECNSAMLGFSERGIKECVLQAHVAGWLVKFYGVRGSGLTDCYAASAREGKFGLERYNDQPEQASVDIDALTAVANHASDLLGVDVYGGDAVVGPDGTITLIDFNDWPSFRTCTVGAAQKIAELIMRKR